MTKYTSRAQMEKPEDGEFADQEVFNRDMDKIDLYGMGSHICTSASRPGTPWMGLKIYETDTKQERIWTGTKWAWIGGEKPYGFFTLASPHNGISTNPALPSGVVLATKQAKGGVTITNAGGYNFVKVPEAGQYRVAVRARQIFTTGVASGAGAILMCIGTYTTAALPVYIGKTELAISYPPGTTPSLSLCASAELVLDLTAGQHVLPLFYRLGGAADWAIVEGDLTAMTIELISG